MNPNRFDGLWVMILLLTAPASPALAVVTNRPASVILSEIRAIPTSSLDPKAKGDEAKVRDHQESLRKASALRANLIGELLQVAPDDPELVTLLPERWQTLMTSFPDGLVTTKVEANQVLSRSKDQHLLAEAAYRNLLVEFWKPQQNGDVSEPLKAFERFVRVVPDDPRAAAFLSTIAGRTSDLAQRKEINNRIIREYPESVTARALVNVRRQIEGIGKPFEIAFTDAITGTRVDSTTLKGKVVILDFWATWCLPCVEEMPELKQIYAEFKGRGVEFVGVSLDEPRDQGGFEKLKGFLETNRIEWPQFYDGQTLATDFATSWGVQAVPVAFAIDAEGNLYSTEARGHVREIITELLSRSQQKASKP